MSHDLLASPQAPGWAACGVDRVRQKSSFFRWPWLESHKLLRWLMAVVREGWNLCGKEVEG